MDIKSREILINKDSLLMDIQCYFSALYPFLKVEFFESAHTTGMLKSTKIDPRTSIKKITKMGLMCSIDINNSRTVSELSHDFQHKLGVIVQVSRKSGNVWNAISLTEGWTLEDQNAAGEFISSEMAMPAKKSLS